MLEWHYRSRDPSLIRVSNAEFYEDGLVLPPSPLQLDPNYGMKFRRVPGVYARGAQADARAATNRIEAQAVVKAVADHARNWPNLSLGVVAFSKTQADMLTELLSLNAARTPSLTAFCARGNARMSSLRTSRTSRAMNATSSSSRWAMARPKPMAASPP